MQRLNSLYILMEILSYAMVELSSIIFHLLILW